MRIEIKTFWLTVACIMILTFLNTTHGYAASTKYTGGLLDNKSLNIGDLSAPTKTNVTATTDNNLGTSQEVSDRAGGLLWYAFDQPQEINSIIVNSDTARSTDLLFYDADNNLVLTYTPVTNNEVETLPQSLKNIKTVVLKTKSLYLKIIEWNVFVKAPAAPAVPKYNRFYAGDKVAKLYWLSSGGESYNVKRGTSAGGPYATIARNVKDLTYTDSNVVNGTTYYYVLSASNEAGESADSTTITVKPDATKTNRGLLDNKPLNIGDLSAPTKTNVTAATDNNLGTSQEVSDRAGGLLWYSFDQPQEINSIIVNSDTPTSTDLLFYDADNNLVLTYTPVTNNEVETLPQSLKNIKTVVLKTKSLYLKVIEWNVFVKAPAAPAAPKYNRFYAGDKVVNLYWLSSGGESYNVKRGTSVGGPYSTIARNVKDLTYTDSSIMNGTTYYYVLSASNEAGESADSSAIAVKPDATPYTGGLLDNKPLNMGMKLSAPTKTNIYVSTDNNLGTSQEVPDNGGLLWYTFDQPKEINSVVVNTSTKAATVMEFYDADNNLLQSYTPATNSERELLPESVKNVKTVILKTKTLYLKVIEWNVFGKDYGQIQLQDLKLTAVADKQNITLSWNAVNGASKYIIKRGTQEGGPYEVLNTVDSPALEYVDKDIKSGTTYYYIVVAQNGSNQNVATSNEVSASLGTETPTPTPGDNDGGEVTGSRALLTIVLNTGVEKEYDLSMSEVKAFIAWYEQRATGSGAITFAIDKHSNNKGPFSSRKDYIIYDKIVTFEVNSYDK